MSMMRFQNKSLDGEWVGGVSSIQFFWDFLNFFNFAKPLTCKTELSSELRVARTAAGNARTNNNSDRGTGLLRTNV